VAARSKEVCGRLVTGIAGSNLARGMDVCLLCLYVVLSCVGRGLCEGLITRPEKSYRVSKCVNIKNLKGGGQGRIWAVEPLDGWNDRWTLHICLLKTELLYKLVSPVRGIRILGN
jgi:hypothetical protein